MQLLRDKILQMSEAEESYEALLRGRSPALVTGLSPVHRAALAAAFAAKAERPLLVLVSDERQAERMVQDLRFFLGEAPLYLPQRGYRFREGTASRNFEYQRIGALHTLLEKPHRAVVATAEAVLQKTLPPEALRKNSFWLRPGESHDLNALTEQLAAAGYQRTAAVEGAGQFALRGGILDIFSPVMTAPVRVEFFGDEIDAMGVFNVDTQRRTENVSEALILPAGEFLPDAADTQDLIKRLQFLAAKAEKKENGAALARTLRADAERLGTQTLAAPDRYLSCLYGSSTVFDYLSPETLLVCSDSVYVAERVRGALAEWKQDVESYLAEGVLAGEFSELYLDASALWARSEDYPTLYLDALPASRYPLPPKSISSLQAKQLSSYGGSLETAAADLRQYLDAGCAVLVLTASEQRAKNLKDMLFERHIPAAVDPAGTRLPEKGEVRITLGAISSGFEYPTLSLAVLTEGQLLARAGKQPRTKKDGNHKKLRSYTDLKPGDLVVHVHHGLGRFVGMERMPVEGVQKDYIKIAYAAGDCLYVPATGLDLVSKFIGGGEDTEHVRLNRLGGTDWAKTTYRAKAAAKDLAKGLIQLYAERMRRPGFAFSPDSPWQQEFEESFGFEETEDQLRAIAEIKRDMERPVPMDRLLCGDVGYGKTEVALRAVMKCVLDGKQAAILVPTTVLAQQHYQTALARFHRYPVNIAVLSRFQTAKQSKKILEELKTGRIDLLIGTHRLLQKGIEFKDLGLLVVDEEQRFGVTHKEKLKEMAKQVDVLTLSATPIPRTLNMALTGIRDMSSIEEPPRGRQTVQTFVLEHDWGVVADAIRRELARNGQVYYLHNRVESIDSVAVKLRKLLGEEVRLLIAHGKMSESELSDVMQKMSDGDADVLVCTTIIETGIDIPNVNTLIIEDADRLGLAQLHQIRGRIGRSPRRAYAYMTYRPAKVLTEPAAKRLTAIREFVEFGSGFRIAMRDLEIRGAGNLLGPEQSGYMSSVGYELYLQLLEEAVLEEQGITPKKRTDCSADLTVNANIPESYIASGEERMDIYRRIAAVRTDEDAEDILDELLDRYGEAPKSVLTLLDVALLRAAAMMAGVRDIAQKGDRVTLTLAEIEPKALAAVCSLQKYRGRLLLKAGDQPALILTLRRTDEVLESTLALVEDLRLAFQENKE